MASPCLGGHFLVPPYFAPLDHAQAMRLVIPGATLTALGFKPCSPDFA